MKNKIHIGCSSFYNARWIAVFYPEELPRSKWFEYYCSQFSSFEINATFYRFPTLKSLESWYSKAPEKFIYAVKAPKTITHIKKFIDCETEISKFYEVCETGLKEKLGPILFQLPPSFHFSEENLELIVKSLNSKYNNTVEFRHKSWWNPEVFEILKKNKITFCNVSHPTLPDTIVANSETGYLRLHGKPKMFYSSYSDEDLENYLKNLEEKNFAEIYIYFNNTASEAGVLNALKTKKLAENFFKH